MIQSYFADEKESRAMPGFACVDMPFSITSMGTARITLTARYPDAEYSKLASDMIVTILLGSVFLYLEDGSSERLTRFDTVCIPQGTKYYWIPESREVIFQATNSPPFQE
jgi:hypothetical protein